MGRFNPLQNAFVAGELSPRMEGRDDLRQYGQGMRQSVNQLVLPQGAVMHRSGTQFESETKGSGPVVLRPFEVGLDQAYVLELGDEYMRFHANEGQVAIATVVNAVNFDGSTTYLDVGSFSGIAATKKVLFSMWFNILGGDGTELTFVMNDSSFLLIRNSSNNLVLQIGAEDGTILWDPAISGTYTVASNPGWHNILISLDASLPLGQVYIDDVLVASETSPGVIADTNIDWANAFGSTVFAVGAASVTLGTFQFNGDMSDVYLNTAESLDLSVTANRRKFIDAAGKPVGLGALGDNPTGNQPTLFLTGATATWEVNKGTGGGMTETGALTTATTSPSD